MRLVPVSLREANAFVDLSAIIACEKLGIDVATVEAVNTERDPMRCIYRVVIVRADGGVRRAATVTDEEITRWPR